MRTPRIRAIWRFWQRSKAERHLALEAILLLMMARFALNFLPFSHIARWASLKCRRPPPAWEGRLRLHIEIQYAVTRCARYVPWTAVCFDQGLAAHRMLRRRGIPSELYWGVNRKADGCLGAHVWVKDGKIDIVGAEGAKRFTAVTRFPRL